MTVDNTANFSSSTQKAFLYADPAAHSLSPRMHNAAFAATGIAAHYEAIRVVPEDLENMINKLRQSHVLGANLSLPHKQSALALLDELTESARSIGAVNTVINKGGLLQGDNTDASGFLDDLKNHKMPPNTRPVLVLGAGGAARAAVFALTQAKSPIYIVNRSETRAEALARDFDSAVCRVQATKLENVPWHSLSLIVNASSAGLDNPAQSPMPSFYFDKCKQANVYDMVYKPPTTKLMNDALIAGLRAANGLGMLASQARLSFMAWTGSDADINIFLSALEKARE